MITSKDIYQKIIEVQCQHPRPTAKQALRELLLKSLSPSAQKVYDLALTEGEITSCTCRSLFGWELNRAGNVLKKLNDLGLLARYCAPDRVFFKYRPSLDEEGE